MRRSRPSLKTALALLLAAPWLLWSLVRLLGLDVRHPLVALMAFTPYAAASAPVPLAVALLLRRWVVAALAALAAGGLVTAVLPRAIDGPREASGDSGSTLVVMTFNLYGGRADARETLALVRRYRVDVLSLQELTPQAVAELDAEGARELLPGRVLEARDGAAGSGLMGRVAVRPVAPRDPSGAAQPEGVILVPGAPALRVKAVHPRPPISRWSENDWRREMRDLPGPQDGRGLRILAGDFNATLDHREFRRLLDEGYVDAADATGDGLRPTWPVRRRRPPITIDHVLLPPGVEARRVTVREVRGSDHRAVIAELALDRG